MSCEGLGPYYLYHCPIQETACGGDNWTCAIKSLMDKYFPTKRWSLGQDDTTSFCDCTYISLKQ